MTQTHVAKVHQVQEIIDSPGDSFPGRSFPTFFYPESKGNIFKYAKMRKKSVMLKNESDLSLARSPVRDVLLSENDLP